MSNNNTSDTVTIPRAALERLIRFSRQHQTGVAESDVPAFLRAFDNNDGEFLDEMEKELNK